MKTKIYKGRKIKVSIIIDGTTYFEEIFNTISSFDEILNDFNYEMYSKIELLEDNIKLYKCEIFKSENLNELCNIRNNISRKIKYSKFLTKKEIEELLKKDYIVCLENYKEIDIEDLKQLL